MDSHEISRRWAERSGEFSPEYYAHRGAGEASERIRRRLERIVGRDAAVLEIGCSSGRHLAHLHGHGFEDLTGVDPNRDAFDVMREVWPAVARDATLHRDTIQAVVDRFPDDRFDAIYTVETLQHLPLADDAIVEELRRVTDGVAVTAENEGDAPDERDGDGPAMVMIDDDVPLYHRDWGAVFERAGFTSVDTATEGRLTVRTHRA